MSLSVNLDEIKQGKDLYGLDQKEAKELDIPSVKNLQLNEKDCFANSFYDRSCLNQPVPLQEDLQKKLGLQKVSSLVLQEKRVDKKVLLICLGGTISMVPSDQGLVVKKGALQELMKNFPRLYDKKYSESHGFNKKTGIQDWYITPKSIYHKRTWYQFHEIDDPIDSSNINSKYYIDIVNIIEEKYSNYDGFLIIHGTDTMCYTASMLSFLIQNLKKTIIITGSMLPLCEHKNDAHNNLVCSLVILGHFTIPEVGIFMNDRLVRGNRAKKRYSMGWDAFDSPMYPPLAVFPQQKDTTLVVNDKYILNCSKNKMPFKVHKDISDNIAVIFLHPALNMNIVQHITTDHKIEGIILESYGAGNIPSNNPLLVKLLKGAVIRGAVVVNISQCYHSNVSPLYETGVILKEIGVVFGYDLTLEATICKLQYLLKKKYLKKDQIRTLIRTSLRGEVTVPKRNHLEKSSSNDLREQEQVQQRPFSLFPEHDSNEEEKLKRLLDSEDEEQSSDSQDGEQEQKIQNF